MDESGSSQGQRLPWTGMKRSDKEALGLLWEKLDAVSAKKSKDVTELQIGVKKSSGGVLLPNLMVEIVSVGAEAGRVEAGKKEAELGRKVICLDMWERLKMKPGGTYVSDDAAEKALLLEKAHDSLKTKYGDSIPQALDFEVGSEIIGWNKRTKLPKAIGAAATLVEGSKFNRIASLRIGGSSPTPSSQLDDVAQEVTQLKQQHQKMEFQIQQQQVIINLTQALLKTSNSQPQPPRPDQDEDDESSD